jgi:hypothetical protein
MQKNFQFYLILSLLLRMLAKEYIVETIIKNKKRKLKMTNSTK